MHIEVIYEDQWLLAVNKPAGLNVHPNSQADDPLRSLEGQVAQGRKTKPILLHRLDQATTGLVLFAKRPEAAAVMSQAFEKKAIRKAYFAVVGGEWPKSVNRIESHLSRGDEGGWVSGPEPSANSRRALTTFRVLLSTSQKTWLEVIPKTGRQHQIRLHCLAAGHPIMGDTRYGDPLGAAAIPQDAPMALHAYRLDFQHPIERSPLTLRASLPFGWRDWLSDFAKNDRERCLSRAFPTVIE